VGVDQDGIEQLPHDAEGQLALKVAPAGLEYAEAVLLGRFASRGEQPALPDAGRPLDQCQAAPALERALDQVAKDTKLAVALEQLAPRLSVDRHRCAWLSRLSLRDLSDDLVDHLRRDLVHAVLLARVHDDLPEDLVVGFAMERGPASGDQHAALEFLHVLPPYLAGG
jgi:hypothetical protein